MGYDFRIEYKKGKENKVANALSRRNEPNQTTEGLLAVITFPTSVWLDELKMTYSTSLELQEILTKL